VLRFLARRIIQGVLVLWLMTMAVFILFFIAPNDVAQRMAGSAWDIRVAAARFWPAFDAMAIHVLCDGNARMSENLRDHVEIGPCASISDAPEWRSSCKCQWPRPARRQIRENQCDTLSGSIGVPKALGKIKSCSRQVGPIAIRSSARRARWRRSSSTSSGVRKRVRHERAVLSSPITKRVRSSEIDVRSRTRFTACVTFSVAASQSNADQCRPSAAPRRSPNASITVTIGSTALRMPSRTCKRSNRTCVLSAPDHWRGEFGSRPTDGPVAVDVTLVSAHC
jgi:hypothetical protein